MRKFFGSVGQGRQEELTQDSAAPSLGALALRAVPAVPAVQTRSAALRLDGRGSIDELVVMEHVGPARVVS
jgi:hypothetical protein